MKNALNFVSKAFFGGCFGCLGAWITTVLVIALVAAIFASTIGPGLVNSVQGFFQNVPNIINNGMQDIFSSGGGDQQVEQTPQVTPESGLTFPSLTCPNDPVPQIKIFLTASKDPTSEHLTQIPLDGSTEAHFWVQAPQGATVKFVLVLSRVDGITQIWDPVFNPDYTSDPGGLPFSVGSFSEPPLVGDYQMTAYLCSVMIGGSLDFTVTP
jgi:hypothetical protein